MPARSRAFTLAEVLAALALMAIVIPVAIMGTGVASRAGELGADKNTAIRIAQRVLQTAVVEGPLQTTTDGTVTENGASYPWSLSTSTWSVDGPDVLTVRVTFTLQGRDFDVSLSTLASPAVTVTTAASRP